ncbi:MAG: DUF4474 domain-containing protein [Oscillospiraceae bacterium]|nr:DUF4474 domain-containing protein [Oscillospiraceae bacterium]
MKKLLSLVLAILLLAGTAVSATAYLTDLERARLPVFRQDRNGVYYIVDQCVFRNSWSQSSAVPGQPLHQWVYGTVRVNFQYDYVVDRDGNLVPKDWLIQFWKGRNGEFLGAEIGVFHKPSTQAAQHFFPIEREHYIGIDITVWQHDFASGLTQRLFARSQPTTQWMTGFVRGNFRNPYENNRGKNEVITTGRLAFPSEEMAQLVAEQMVAAGFRQSEMIPTRRQHDTLALRGNSIYFTWQFIDQDVPSHRRGVDVEPPEPVFKRRKTAKKIFAAMLPGS